MRSPCLSKLSAANNSAEAHRVPNKPQYNQPACLNKTAPCITQLYSILGPAVRNNVHEFVLTVRDLEWCQLFHRGQSNTKRPLMLQILAPLQDSTTATL